MARKRTEQDEVLEALDQLVEALSEGIDRMEFALDLASAMRERRLDGETHADIEVGMKGPGLQELIANHVLAVQSEASRLRRAWARTLRSEGLTVQEIGELFGVSHQRVSFLLNRDAGEPR